MVVPVARGDFDLRSDLVGTGLAGGVEAVPLFLKQCRGEARFVGVGLFLRSRGLEDGSFGVAIEELRLLGESLPQSRVDRSRGEESVDEDSSRLSHPMRSRERLCFESGRQLRFEKDHCRGALEIETDASGDNLSEQDRPGGRRAKSFDDLFPFGGGDSAVDRPHRLGHVSTSLQRVEEVAEDHHLAPLFAMLFEALEHSLQFGGGRSFARAGRDLSEAHEVATADEILILGALLLGEFDPLVALESRGEFGQNVPLRSPEIDLSDTLLKLLNTRMTANAPPACLNKPTGPKNKRRRRDLPSIASDWV